MIRSESFDQNPIKVEFVNQGVEIAMTKEQYDGIERLLKEDTGITVEEYKNDIILQYVNEQKEQ